MERNTFGREHNNKTVTKQTSDNIINNTTNEQMIIKRNSKIIISETFVAAKTKINIKAGGQGQLELILNYSVLPEQTEQIGMGPDKWRRGGQTF